MCCLSTDRTPAARCVASIRFDTAVRSNVARWTTVGDDAVLYPGGALKEDDYYFQKERAKCDDSSSRQRDGWIGSATSAGHTSAPTGAAALARVLS
jgi:hypothetical protein